MSRIKELIELAAAGEAADFTEVIQEALKERAFETVVEMAEGPEDEDLDDAWDDNIDDLPLEDDVADLDDDDVEELEERNALNKEKSRAFRAGVKDAAVKDSHMPYISSRDRRWDKEGSDRKVAQAKQAKDNKKQLAKHIFDTATEKGKDLGGKPREFQHVRDKGRETYDKYKAGWKNDNSKEASNARTKEMYGQGKYLHQHLDKQHRHLSRQADDLHNEISRALNSDTFRGRDKAKYGDTFGWRKDGDEPTLQPHHLDNLKKLHHKLSAIHHVVKSMNEESIDWEAIEEDLIDIEDAYIELLSELDEGKTYSRRSWDDDRIRDKGGAKKYSRRRDRRQSRVRMEELEDAEPGSLTLADDLTDEELQDLADNITEEHLELLDELSFQKLTKYMNSAASDQTDARHSFDPRRANKRTKGIARASVQLARK